MAKYTDWGQVKPLAIEVQALEWARANVLDKTWKNDDLVVLRKTKKPFDFLIFNRGKGTPWFPQLCVEAWETTEWAKVMTVKSDFAFTKHAPEPVVWADFHAVVAAAQSLNTKGY